MGAGASAAHYIDDASAVEPSLIVGTLNMIADDANPWQFEPPSCVHPRFPPARPPRGTCAIGDARGGDARAPPIIPPPHALVARATARAAPREGQWAEGRLSRERTEGEEGWSRRARRRGPCRHVIENRGGGSHGLDGCEHHAPACAGPPVRQGVLSVRGSVLGATPRYGGRGWAILWGSECVLDAEPGAAWNFARDNAARACPRSSRLTGGDWCARAAHVISSRVPARVPIGWGLVRARARFLQVSSRALGGPRPVGRRDGARLEVLL